MYNILQVERKTEKEMGLLPTNQKRREIMKFFFSKSYNGKQIRPLVTTSKIDKDSKLRRKSMPVQLNEANKKELKPFSRRSLNGINIKDLDVDRPVSPVVPSKRNDDRKSKYYSC